VDPVVLGLEMNLYITADKVGLESGGGKVTANEWEAFQTLGPAIRISRDELGECQDPWGWDQRAKSMYDWYSIKPKLAHFYSGSFPELADRLKWAGAKITWTIAAHDRAVSKREHEKLGMGFPYPHLVTPAFWKQYIYGYSLADIIITPGSVPAKTVREYGTPFDKKRIEIIHHGFDLPELEKIKPLPSVFTVGNLGSWGPDKGIVYLLHAWKELGYRDAILLLAGRDSSQPYAREFVRQHGGGNVQLIGWMKNPTDFYNQLSLYIQPSATEGFGLEILESMAHARPVLCSRGAGAQDIVGSDALRFDACNSKTIADHIDHAKKVWPLSEVGKSCRELTEKYTWSKIKQQYINVWKSLL
jgi:glycosyltransferase involved in cell wall biosynthesis